MTISELAGAEVVAVMPNDTLAEAASVMYQREVGSTVVMVDQALEGILTERDILAAVAAGVDLEIEQVSEHMTLLPDSFGPDFPVGDAANWMLATGYRHMPIVNPADEVIGMISIKDILWAVTDSGAGV